jgi:integrase
MPQRLSDKIIAKLPAPKKGNKIYYDAPAHTGNGWTAGFGVRITAAGARSYILNYRTKGGRQRRYTIGSPPDWTLAAARDEAAALKRKIDQGEDPLGTIRAGREAPTVADLCDRFTEEFLHKKRPATQRGYKRMIAAEIIPAIGSIKVAAVDFSDVDKLHRKVGRRAPYTANRCVALLSKMFSLAIKWKYRAAGDNPAKGIERNPEEKRERFLDTAELARLGEALAGHGDKAAADILRLLTLTGARRNEVQAMRWADLDLEKGTWTKPASTTKQAKLHRVPLSGPARLLLAKLAKAAEDGAEFVFPGRLAGHRVELKADWAEVCKKARIKDARIHDLRHSYASVLAGAGHSLPIIGKLLGHSQAATTQRYAHLLDDPLRAATETAGAVITAGDKPSAEIMPMPTKGGRR